MHYLYDVSICKIFETWSMATHKFNFGNCPMYSFKTRISIIVEYNVTQSIRSNIKLKLNKLSIFFWKFSFTLFFYQLLRDVVKLPITIVSSISVFKFSQFLLHILLYNCIYTNLSILYTSCELNFSGYEITDFS